MAISDEMREQLEMIVQYGDQVKAMFKEQDDVDYEIVTTMKRSHNC